MPKKRRVVYTITVVSGTDRAFRCREWGYYFKEKWARKVIEENQTDISEADYYHYGILGEKGEGPLALTKTIQFYEFIWKEDKFIRAKKIKCPAKYKQMFY